MSLVVLFLPVLSFLSGCDYLTANAINDYLTDIAAIQRDSNLELLDLNQYVSSLGGDPEQIQEAITGLEDCLTTIDEARASFDALEVPEDAQKLHNDLLELYAKGSSVVEDLIRAGRYQLDMEPILTGYEAASSDFNQSLQSAADSSSLLTAMRTYQTAIEILLQQATPLTPPTIATNSHKRFLGNLGTLHDMITAIEQDDVEAVGAASEKISSMSAGDAQLETDMLADREADVKAYNAQILQMSALMQEIQKEQEALRQRFETG